MGDEETLPLLSEMDLGLGIEGQGQVCAGPWDLSLGKVHEESFPLPLSEPLLEQETQLNKRVKVTALLGEVNKGNNLFDKSAGGVLLKTREAQPHDPLQICSGMHSCIHQIHNTLSLAACHSHFSLLEYSISHL